MTHPAAQIIRDEHAALAAMLRSMRLLIAGGPCDEPERFFDVLRAMLFYIDEFPERLHHPKESRLLFPKVAAAAPELAQLIGRLHADHDAGERRVRDLQHELLAWELLGDAHREPFLTAAEAYIAFYLEHMRLEEREVLPAAERVLSEGDWDELHKVFSRDRDPLASGVVDACYDRLFTRIVLRTPAPIGVGPALTGEAHAH
jgi:hemerythrin-like domain-containing protein